MSKRPPVMIWDEDTPREHRATRHIVGSLDRKTRLAVARCFIGWHVAVELDDPGAPPVNYNLTGADRWVLKGYVEAIALSHGGGADMLLLTLPGDLHDLSQFHAYSLATVRSITTLGRGSA